MPKLNYELGVGLAQRTRFGCSQEWLPATCPELLAPPLAPSGPTSPRLLAPPLPRLPSPTSFLLFFEGLSAAPCEATAFFLLIFGRCHILVVNLTFLQPKCRPDPKSLEQPPMHSDLCKRAEVSVQKLSYLYKTEPTCFEYHSTFMLLSN